MLKKKNATDRFIIFVNVEDEKCKFPMLIFHKAPGKEHGRKCVGTKGQS